jgi:hypothetical protein
VNDSHWNELEFLCVEYAGSVLPAWDEPVPPPTDPNPTREIKGSEAVILEAETGDGRALETRREVNQLFLNDISSSRAVKHCLSKR